MALQPRLETRTNRRIFNGLFWIAIVVHGALALVIAKPWLTGDSHFYLRLASSIDHGFYGWLEGGKVQPDALRPPGYPIILWLLLHRLHVTIPFVVGLQICLYLVSILLIDRRLRRESISTVPFRILALIYPFGAIYCGFIMAEAWATLALTGLALLVSADRLTTPRIAWAGIIAGLAILLRGDLLLLPLVIAIIVMFRNWRSVAAPALLGRALLPILAAAAVLAPYVLWNARHFDRPSPIPVASAIGNSLYLATWQGKVPLEDLNALYGGVTTPRVVKSGLADEIHHLNARFGAEPNTAPFNPATYPTVAMQRQSSAIYLKAAERRIRTDPGAYVRHVAGNIWALWNTSTYPAGIPLVGRLGLTLISGIVCIGGIVGLLVARQARQAIAAAGVVLLYPMVIHLPLHTEARYTAAVRPLLLMFASLAVLWLVNCYRSRQWQSGRQLLGSL
jgi:hypothetical protein